MKKTLIWASYHYRNDTYQATVLEPSGYNYTLSCRNGADLVHSIKKHTGIEVEYNPFKRTYSIPQENLLPLL